jgi:hypothetical protein
MRASIGEWGARDDGTSIDMGPLLYRRHGPMGIVEVRPEHCPQGHTLTYPNVKIGWDGECRTYTCLTCREDGTLPHTMRYTAGPDVTGTPCA